MKKSILAIALAAVSATSFAGTDTAEIQMNISVTPACIFTDLNKVYDMSISGAAGEVAYGNVTVSTQCSSQATPVGLQPRNEIARSFGSIDAGAVDQTVGTMTLLESDLVKNPNQETLTLRPFKDALTTSAWTSANPIVVNANGTEELNTVYFKLTGTGPDFGEGQVIVNKFEGTAIQFPIEVAY